ncbi:DODA-type extradiol aromatic ring-opening family dioxygenase [Terracidiphilus gabretensis]|jgi:aromatic ring-opening dioxygenase catalytic subunit (LigB family)|uniref:DODA-type extradiol aromatic ring-opening family dioxygenase n=1 Tax=Terracidiphilus gabretensis TaxID=1577687 RepID=UPI00071B35A0|nr:class III extradiol ring-cleavage dioxygenase [Terracidiphilus gabretensis]
MSHSTPRQPSIFLPHGGGPCFFMDWTWGPADTWHATERFLAGLAATLAPPRALLVISSHWEEAAFTMSTAAHPELIFDYSGFPTHTYKLTWPAPGDPELASQVRALLKDAGLPAAESSTRGYDHGVFVPLKVAFPQAQIPVVTLSLASSLDPALHIAAGRALAPLRDEGVLIVGSGMSFHNLRAYMHPETRDRARAFDHWLTEAVEQPEPIRSTQLANWRTAPNAAFAHPREEHLIPLMVAAGAGGDVPGKRIFSDEPMGAAISAYRFDG